MAQWEVNKLKSYHYNKTETLAPGHMNVGTNTQHSYGLNTGWVPPDHTSTCGHVHVCFCLLDNLWLISHRMNIASTVAIVCLLDTLP